MPAWFGAATEMAADPGSEASGIPRAADVDVDTAGERMVAECANSARRRRIEIEAQTVGAVRLR